MSGILFGILINRVDHEKVYRSGFEKGYFLGRQDGHFDVVRKGE